MTLPPEIWIPVCILLLIGYKLGRYIERQDRKDRAKKLDPFDAPTVYRNSTGKE